MNIHRARMLAIVIPAVRSLPPYLFGEQKKLCMKCASVRIAAQVIRSPWSISPVMVCAAECQSEQLVACLDARTDGQCGAAGSMFSERQAAA